MPIWGGVGWGGLDLNDRGILACRARRHWPPLLSAFMSAVTVMASGLQPCCCICSKILAAIFQSAPVDHGQISIPECHI